MWRIWLCVTGSLADIKENKVKAFICCCFYPICYQRSLFSHSFMSASDPVTHNQIHHIHNLTPLVTNKCFELLLLATCCDSLTITLLCTNHWLNCITFVNFDTDTLQLCCAESFWGWSTIHSLIGAHIKLTVQRQKQECSKWRRD